MSGDTDDARGVGALVIVVVLALSVGVLLSDPENNTLPPSGPWFYSAPVSIYSVLNNVVSIYLSIYPIVLGTVNVPPNNDT